MKKGQFKIDLTGNRYGRVTVLSRAESRNYQVYWNCVCDCGTQWKVRADHLQKGFTQSCGCLGKEIRTNAITTHGQTSSRLYSVWQSMKNRCYNSNVGCYKNYGGRGITVCDEWLNNFEAFSQWAYENGYDTDAPYGQCTIERKDNDGPYAPWNCRWATLKEQAANKRPRLHRRKTA